VIGDEEPVFWPVFSAARLPAVITEKAERQLNKVRFKIRFLFWGVLLREGRDIISAKTAARQMKKIIGSAVP
jgi:hypothetical protein